MRTTLIIIAVAVALPIIIGFLWGTVRTLSKTGQKRERDQAAALLAEIPKGAFGVLLLVFAAFRRNDVTEANRVGDSHGSETDALLRVLDRPRHPALSAGNAGDHLNLTVWTGKLEDQEYSPRVSEVIAFVFHHHLEALLDEVIQSRI